MGARKKLQMNIYLLFLYSIIFYTFSTLTYSLLPNIPFSRIFGMLISIITVVLYLRNLTLKKAFLLIFCTFILVYTMLISKNQAINLNDAIWVISTILLIGLASDKKFNDIIQLEIYKHEKVMKRMILIIEIILMIAILMPSSYGNGWNWGSDALYFVGFAKNSHTFASVCCLLIVLIMSIHQEKKLKVREYLYYILPIYGILFSGARTFLISLFILLMINIITKITGQLKRNITIITIVISLIVAYLNSSMASKFEFASNNNYAHNTLDSLTSGRTQFWIYDLELYINSNIFYKVFGRGFDYIYDYNLNIFGISIWAHNDIINNLISIGLIGTLIYLYVWFSYLRTLTFRYNSNFNITNLIIITLFSIYIFAPMLINGLFSYQHYIYSCVLLGQFVYKKIGIERSVQELKKD